MTATSNTIHDEQLPQLSIVLNTAMMQVVLESSLNCQIEDCRILQCRYKPSKTCLVSYALTIVGEYKVRIVYVRIYPANQSLLQYQKARATASLSRSVLHLPAFEMVAWLFPNDRKIHALGDITDEANLRAGIVPQIVTEQFGNIWQITSLQSDIVHYVAEHTCTVKVQMDLTAPTKEGSSSLVLFGKAYYNDQGEMTFQAMQSLQQHGAHIARPLHYQPHLKTLWQVGLKGQPLHELMLENERFPTLLAEAAKAVAQLHSLGAQVAGVARTRSERTESLMASACLLTLVKPESKARIQALLARLAAEAPSFTARPDALLHGDLHLKNFFMTGDRIALIDLDNLALGDPLVDLGSFVASLYYRQLLGELPNAPALIRTFIEAYRAEVGWSFSAADLRWQIVASIISERISRCITRLKASHLIDDLLDLAARIQTGDEP